MNKVALHGLKLSVHVSTEMGHDVLFQFLRLIAESVDIFAVGVWNAFCYTQGYIHEYSLCVRHFIASATDSVSRRRWIFFRR